MDLSVESLVNIPDCDSAITLYEEDGHASHDPNIIIKIKRHRNSLLPIYRLHRELLHYVLQLVLPDRSATGFLEASFPFPFYTALFRARRVSHAWNHEIINTPLFWALISSRFHQSFQDLILERSGDVALEVNVSRRLGAYSGPKNACWTETEKDYLERVMSREIRGLCTRLPFGETFVPHLTDHDRPRMSSLALYGRSELLYTGPLPTLHLAELHLVQCGIVWSRFRSLRSLSINSTRGPNLLQLVQVLQSSPLLEYLNLYRIEIFPENPSDGAVIPPNPINLPRLSTIIIEDISFDLPPGLLERLIPSDACRISTIDVELEQGRDLSGFCHHAGRCISRGLTQQVIAPRVYIMTDALHLQMGLDIWLHISVIDWSGWEEQSTTPPRTQLTRIFFEAEKGILLRSPISQFYLRADSIPLVAEGIAIAHEFFPGIAELDIATEDGLEALEALAEPMNEGGKSVWRLRKLSVLKIRVLGRGVHYDRTIAMVIKRTQAAALSPGALSSITSLKCACACVQRQSLDSLDEAGIKYELDSVVVI